MYMHIPIYIYTYTSIYIEAYIYIYLDMQNVTGFFINTPPKTKVVSLDMETNSLQHWERDCFPYTLNPKRKSMPFFGDSAVALERPAKFGTRLVSRV